MDNRRFNFAPPRLLRDLAADLETLAGRLDNAVHRLQVQHDHEIRRENMAVGLADARRRRALATAERDMKIMKLARRGWTNKDIGAKVGLHPATVGKIIRRVMAETRPE